RLLRDELGFQGVSVTDALDMGAISTAEGAADVAAILAAGVDLLLCGPDVENSAAVEGALRAIDGRSLDASDVAASAQRVRALRTWLAGFEQPPLDVVGSAEHGVLAAELARRSITLVRDDAGILPVRSASDAQLLVVE